MLENIWCICNTQGWIKKNKRGRFKNKYPVYKEKKSKSHMTNGDDTYLKIWSTFVDSLEVWRLILNHDFLVKKCTDKSYDILH